MIDERELEEALELAKERLRVNGQLRQEYDGKLADLALLSQAARVEELEKETKSWQEVSEQHCADAVKLDIKLSKAVEGLKGSRKMLYLHTHDDMVVREFIDKLDEALREIGEGK